ncbi:OsmC family protein [Lysinibacter cavernae]|uniref:Organic hydroperoxide reductase OsmC/OhrA n=1 Tax=Lysinibacter cavernae TaxID=1640652 RepID=A0A7X5QYA4_9MICO|nr:OsmC family protein [Lysinibacter cavernae]NIH52167.1 organic hydroperoxide reductase OsmC/OhrA [Lysinibacter cavernae]
MGNALGRDHQYAVTVEWQGNLGSGTSGYREYSREHTVFAEGKHPIEGSADKPFRGDPGRWNPEEMLLAALAQCHMMSYLHVAVESGVVVVEYTDAATGSMRLDGHGGGAFSEAVLHPVVTVKDAAMVDAALAAHRRARELCFIANSVNFPVHHVPVVQVEADLPD